MEVLNSKATPTDEETLLRTISTLTCQSIKAELVSHPELISKVTLYTDSPKPIYYWCIPVSRRKSLNDAFGPTTCLRDTSSTISLFEFNLSEVAIDEVARVFGNEDKKSNKLTFISITGLSSPLSEALLNALRSLSKSGVKLMLTMLGAYESRETYKPQIFVNCDDEKPQTLETWRAPYVEPSQGPLYADEIFQRDRKIGLDIMQNSLSGVPLFFFDRFEQLQSMNITHHCDRIPFFGGFSCAFLKYLNLNIGEKGEDDPPAIWNIVAPRLEKFVVHYADKLPVFANMRVGERTEGTTIFELATDDGFQLSKPRAGRMAYLSKYGLLDLTFMKHYTKIVLGGVPWFALNTMILERCTDLLWFDNIQQGSLIKTGNPKLDSYFKSVERLNVPALEAGHFFYTSKVHEKDRTWKHTGKILVLSAPETPSIKATKSS